MSQIQGALRAIRRKFRVYFQVFLPQVGVALATLGSKWPLLGSAETKFPHLRPLLCPAKVDDKMRWLKKVIVAGIAVAYAADKEAAASEST